MWWYETINYIICECSKLAQKVHKTRHDLIGKEIHRQLCKNFNHTNKWYMHSPESILENETQKFLLDFEIQTDHLISARRADIVIVNIKNENLLIGGLCAPGRLQNKIKRKRKEKWI